MPVGETVAIEVSEEVHAAEVVMSSEVPVASIATAKNCAVDPTAGTVPLMVTVETVAGAVGDFDPQAAVESATARANSRTE